MNNYAVFVGPDFSGKSTLSKKVAALLDWCHVGEPFMETESSAKIKNAIINNTFDRETEVFLSMASRAEAFETVISPNIQKGVIGDRSVICSMVYQAGYYSQLDILDLNISALKTRACNPFPAHVFFLAITHEEYLSRLATSGREPDAKEIALKDKSNWDKLIKDYGEAITWFKFRAEQKGHPFKTHFITSETTAEEVVELIKNK